MSIESVRALIKSGEGSVSHMYLDTRGNVTVGVGQLLQTAADAINLPFVNRNTRSQATPEEIEQDYNNVAQQQGGHLASSYKKYTTLDLPDLEVDALLDRRISEFQAGLQGAFHGYEAYPDAAKNALLDMSFNLGLNGLVKKFPKLKHAAESGEWGVCAEECERRGIGEDRNRVTKELFEQAAQG